MNDVLRDVISVAAEGSARSHQERSHQERGGQERGRVTNLAAARSTPAAASAAAAGPAASELGRNGLRQAFWICGFHEVLLERERRGERLSDQEQSLISLSRNDFRIIRPAVVEMALHHLHGVVHDPAFLPATPAAASPNDVFAIETLRRLAAHGQQTLREDGPDAAMALFGGGPATVEPLAIFQLVFSAALNLLDGFDQLTAEPSAVLARLSRALDAEVGTI
ncbi:MAG: hypothetical protein ACRYGM_06080 [Janthinobacterium lividum]